MVDSGNSRDQSGWLRAATWMGEHADPLLALLLGVAAGLAGVFGWISGDELPAATLIVLSVVAFSLLRERSLRLKASSSLEAANDGIRSLQSGHPYHVLLDEPTWDITAYDGSEACATRLKKLKFDQNDVLSLYDFVQSDATDELATYTPGKRVHDFRADGRLYSLIALGRFYSRDEELDFKIERKLKNAFCNPQERVNIRCLDVTAQQRITVIWPNDRPPTAVRLARASAQNIRQSEDVTQQVKRNKGRATYTLDNHQPERGCLVTIEWDW